MSAKLSTRIIDGDGHIFEDNSAIIAHMEAPYRDIAARKGIFFHLWITCIAAAPSKPRHSEISAPRWGRRAGWISSTTSGHRVDGALSHDSAFVRKNCQPRLCRSCLSGVQRLALRRLREV
jgi:hypothetical protein